MASSAAKQTVSDKGSSAGKYPQIKEEDSVVTLEVVTFLH